MHLKIVNNNAVTIRFENLPLCIFIYRVLRLIRGIGKFV